MEDHLEYLANRVYAGRYKGRIADIRRSFEAYRKHRELPEKPSRWTLIATAVIFGSLGVVIAWGLLGSL